LQAGAFVPEVVIDHPEVVRQLHRDFVHAGSDAVEAFTYYAHREKLRLIGKQQLLEEINRQALSIAREVADESGALLAGGVCNSNVYADDDESRRAVRSMLEEQVRWAAEANVDYIIGETFDYFGEGMIALEVIKEAGIPAVITFVVHQAEHTRDGVTPEEACRRAEEAGADVVGLNCGRGPATMLPTLERIRSAVKGYVAALPVPYRTTPEQPTFQSLRDPQHGGMPFPTALDPFVCTRYEVADFARSASEIGVNYLGLCCGAGPHHVRSLAEALGRRPPASRYSADMSKHAFFGTDDTLKTSNQEYASQL
jgi:betaine-homocysteine S-methyltransferase